MSILSANLSWNAYKVNEANRRDIIAPKLTAFEVRLTHPRGKAQDTPVVTYQIKNYGTLVTNDIHTYLNYRYAVSPVDLAKLVPSVGMNNESIGLGAKLVPGDHLNKTFPLFTHQENVSTRADQLLFKTSATPPSYQKLRDGLALLQIEISTQASDATGHRIVSCDSFEYQWITDAFDRRGDCPANDITKEFRNPGPPGVMRPVPQEGLPSDR